MSDTEIRVWLCACLLLIVGLGVAVGYLLGMVSFLVERVGRAPIGVIDKYMPGGAE